MQLLQAMDIEPGNKVEVKVLTHEVEMKKRRTEQVIRKYDILEFQAHFVRHHSKCLIVAPGIFGKGRERLLDEDDV